MMCRRAILVCLFLVLGATSSVAAISHSSNSRLYPRSRIERAARVPVGAQAEFSADRAGRLQNAFGRGSYAYWGIAHQTGGANSWSAVSFVSAGWWIGPSQQSGDQSMWEQFVHIFKEDDLRTALAWFLAVVVACIVAILVNIWHLKRKERGSQNQPKFNQSSILEGRSESSKGQEQEITGPETNFVLESANITRELGRVAEILKLILRAHEKLSEEEITGLKTAAENAEDKVAAIDLMLEAEKDRAESLSESVDKAVNFFIERLGSKYVAKEAPATEQPENCFRMNDVMHQYNEYRESIESKLKDTEQLVACTDSACLIALHENDEWHRSAALLIQYSLYHALNCLNKYDSNGFAAMLANLKNLYRGLKVAYPEENDWMIAWGRSLDRFGDAASAKIKLESRAHPDAHTLVNVLLTVKSTGLKMSNLEFFYACGKSGVHLVRP